MHVASFFLNLGDNVDLTSGDSKTSICIKLHEESDLNKNEEAKKAFPELKKKLKFTEKGTELFMKITSDINKHNQEDARKIEKVFKNKFPMITYILIAFNIIMWLVPAIFGETQNMILDF
jgi:thiamine kinase-like enzyme